ncbi:uncharacterized protein VP01_5247g2, partial [Puccinia sorghi]
MAYTQHVDQPLPERTEGEHLNWYTDPNKMDLSAMNSQISGTNRAKSMKNGQFFHCRQKGHLSRDCPRRTSQSSRPVKLSDLEAE